MKRKILKFLLFYLCMLLVALATFYFTGLYDFTTHPTRLVFYRIIFGSVSLSLIVIAIEYTIKKLSKKI